MECDDYLLLAGDSQASSGTLKVPVRKLDFMQTPPLAWGFAGDESIGLDFAHWLRQRQWRDSDDWESFRQEAAIALAKLNGRRRELAELSKTTVGDDQLTDVLLAGFVGAQPGILQMESNGGSYLRRMHAFAAIGDGSTHAHLVRGTLEHLGALQQFDSIKLIGFVTNLAAHYAPRSNPPVRVLRVQKDGVQDISRNPAESR